MKNSRHLTGLWIFVSFIFWVLAFRGFLTSKLELSSDALSYYDHTKFFIENLKSGNYPLWDPFWYYGSPNDFFLRRIGAFNPFYLVIILFKSIGIPYTLSYLWFLALYYWSGMIAFYLLAKRIYQNRFIAYAGYLILLFSALGTRLFDSYMMLVTVPLIWFFYFLVAFSQTPRKHFFLGMTLSLMILLGTYIPLYFLISLGFFILLFGLVYFDQIPRILGSYIQFFKENKILVFLSLILLAFTFLPTINFFHNTARGQIVLPYRHGSAGAGETLIVPHQTLDWGAIEDLMYSAYFSNLKLYKFAVVYVPFFALIVFVLGLISHISRHAVLMFLLGITLFCCIVPHGLPFYDFFYRHVFFLKYFRNLHFFIWFFLLPLFVLLVLEHWKMFAQLVAKNTRHRRGLLGYVGCVHLLAIIFVWWRNDAIFNTYVMIVLSFIFWSLIILGRLKDNGWGFALLTLTVLIQPWAAYHYLSLKATPHVSPYSYDFSYTSLKLKDTDIFPGDISSSKDPLYYASGAYNSIYQSVSNYALRKYLQNKILLVDRLKLVNNDNLAPALEKNFLTDDNTAIILKDEFQNKAHDNELGPFNPHPSTKAVAVDDKSSGFKLLGFNANHLRFALDVPYKKFLIYNDSYDPYWQVRVNHQPMPLYEVNGAFKGTWIPAGKSIIEFNYGTWWQYSLNIALSIFAFILLLGLIWYARLS